MSTAAPQAPVLSAAGSGSYHGYNSHYARSGNTLPAWEAAERQPARFASQAAWLPESKDARILDFGCGWGQNLMRLWCAGYRFLEGVDISPDQAELANRAAGGRIRVHAADGREFLALRHSHYDLITLISVLEHFPATDAVALLDRVRHALVPGGRVVVFVPNMANLTSAWIHHSDLTHRTGFTELSLAQALEQAGFEDHRFVTSLGWNPAEWRPWRPWRGLAFRELLNVGLHRAFYRIAGQSPRPAQVSASLEVYSHRPMGRLKDSH